MSWIYAWLLAWGLTMGIGDIVHFTDVNGRDLPAIVQSVDSPTVLDLQVFFPRPTSNLVFFQNISQGAVGQVQTWHPVH